MMENEYSMFRKAIQEHEKGRKAEDVCRELGVSTVTFYKWGQRYAGLEVSELKRSKSWKKRTASSNGCMPT